MKCYQVCSATSENNIRSVTVRGPRFWQKQPPFREMCFIILCGFAAVGQWRKTFRLPWNFDCSFSNNATRDSGHTADTATPAPQRNCGKCQIYGPMGDWWKGFPPHSAKPLSKTEPLESFWLRPSKAEGSCIPHFPWDLMKYTASGLLSIWSFRLLNQWKKDPSCHKRHMFRVTCCSGVLMPVVDIISTPYTLITIHSVQTLQSALRQGSLLNQH